MMKMKYSALLLATSLLAAPTWVMAEPNAAEQQAKSPNASYQNKMQRNGDGHKAHAKMYKRGYQYQQQMDPEDFEKYLDKRLDKLATPELKAQFIKASQARLTAQEQQMQLRKLMAEQKAEDITDKALKDATLEKVAADHKLKQLRIKQMQEMLTKAKK